MGGGLALGKEGPLVHTGACIASLLGQVSRVFIYLLIHLLVILVLLVNKKAIVFFGWNCDVVIFPKKKFTLNDIQLKSRF